MVARVNTIVFRGIEGVPVVVQVMIAPGKVMMQNTARPGFADTVDLAGGEHGL